MAGYSATIEIAVPDDCPIATASTQTSHAVESTARTSIPTTEGTIVEEFCVDATDDHAPAASTDTELTVVHDGPEQTVYRFEREAASCACDIVEATGTPISSVSATDGTLELTLRVPDLDHVTTIIDELRDRYDSVMLTELTQSLEPDSNDPVTIDRGKLTERQREVIETAHEMGYFAYPKGANASEVADELGISRSTFTEHVAAGQSKLFADLLGV